MNEIAPYAQRAVVPAVIVVLTIAVYTDCRWRLIKNHLTIPATALGLLLHILISGWSGLLFGLLGLAVGLALMMIPFTLGQMGGGDVKLMAAVGAFVGAYGALNVFLYTTLVGGLLAIGFAFGHKQASATLGRAWRLTKGMFTFRTLLSDKPETDPEQGITIPYGLAIAAGTVIYLALGKIV